MNTILSSCQYVVDRAAHVRIDDACLHAFADAFAPASAATHWIASAPVPITGLTTDEQLAFLFLLATQAFCFWGEPRWTVEYGGKKYDGTWAMIVALWRAREEGTPIFDFAFWSTLTDDAWRHLFRGAGEIPFFAERCAMMREVGSVLCAQYDGSVRVLIAAADHNAMTLLTTIVDAMPSFRDTSPYDGETIHLYKRAQFFIADADTVLRAAGEEGLADADQLTACADYKLPQMLRKHGILVYAPALAKIVDTLTLIPHDAPEEVEIRATTIIATERIAVAIRVRGISVTARHVNDALWMASQTKSPDDRPYHRTRTTTY